MRRILLLLTICAPAARAQSIRDSAGIRIVTHPATARPKATWRIAPAPILQIGGSDGRGPTEFARVWGVARTANGGVVVSNEPEQELRVFDAQGRHVRTFGRRGKGPGEFDQIRGVVIYGDTVYALDSERSAAFTLDGKLVVQATPTVLTPYHPIDPWGVLRDGSSIHTAAGHETRESASFYGTRIEMRGLFRIAPDGRSAKLLDTVPTYEHFRAEGAPPGGRTVTFAPYTSVAVFGNRLCLGRGTKYEIRCTNADGQLKQIIRREVAPVPVSAAARDAYLAAAREPITSGEGAGTSQARLDAFAAGTIFATNFPAFSWLLRSTAEELWVSDFNYLTTVRMRNEPVPASAIIHWNVFAADGSWSGALDLPARFTPKEAGRDYVVGISKDDDDVASVTMYRLIR